MQYVLGLSRLGHDVLYLEDSGEWPYVLDGDFTSMSWVARDARQNISHVDSTMRRFELNWAYRNPLENKWHGISDNKRREFINTADLLINVSGSLENPNHYRGRAIMAYIDTDPIFTQTKIARGEEEFAARVAAHDVHFSFGEALSSSVPPTEFIWRPTRQPVVLDEWRHDVSPRPNFTTVMNWTSYRPLEWKGQTYAQKDVEFEKFRALPALIPEIPLELAIGSILHREWEGKTRSQLPSLKSSGWLVADAFEICAGLDAYRNYVLHSKAEWSVAKNGYVVGRPGWFSDRSACYLAAGRPVVVQDTGFSSIIPTGRGVLSFSTIDEAANDIKAVTANYRRHSRAATDIAASFFSSDDVLNNLIEVSVSV